MDVVYRDVAHFPLNTRGARDFREFGKKFIHRDGACYRLHVWEERECFLGRSRQGCHLFSEPIIATFHQKAEVYQHVHPDDRDLDVCYDEAPIDIPSKPVFECEGDSSVRVDGRAVSFEMVVVGAFFALGDKCPGEHEDVGAGVNQESKLPGPVGNE
jgi:hypothetical protein